MGGEVIGVDGGGFGVPFCGIDDLDQEVQLFLCGKNDAGVYLIQQRVHKLLDWLLRGDFRAVVANPVGQDDLAACEVHQVLQVYLARVALIDLLLPSSHEHETVLGMSLAVQLDLVGTNYVPFFPAFLDGEVEQLIAEGHRIGKVAHLLADDEDFELLCGVDGGDEAGAFFDHFGVQLPDLLRLAVALSARVEDGGELKRLSGARVPELDVGNSFEEGIVD